MYQIFLIKAKVALTQNNFPAILDKVFKLHFNHLQKSWRTSWE